jgi:hypothetical protein
MDHMEDQVPETAEASDEPAKKSCTFCESLAAAAGYLIAGFVFLIGFDLITKGAISRRVNRNDVILRDVEAEEEEDHE